MITKDELKRIATLSGLKIEKSELPRLAKELSEVLDHIGELDQVDCTDELPTSQTTGLVNVYRDDMIDESKTTSHSEATAQSKRVVNGYFVTENVLKNKS